MPPPFKSRGYLTTANAGMQAGVQTISEPVRERLERLGVRLDGSLLTVTSLSEDVLIFVDNLPFCIEHADCRADPAALGVACKEARHARPRERP